MFAVIWSKSSQIDLKVFKYFDEAKSFADGLDADWIVIVPVLYMRRAKR